MSEEIKRVIKSYESVIDFDEPEEVMHLIADLVEISNEKECKCEDVLSLEERAQLGDILIREMDGYYEEIKDIFKEPSKSSPNPEEREANTELERDFMKWRDITNSILKKCDLAEWKIS